MAKCVGGGGNSCVANKVREICFFALSPRVVYEPRRRETPTPHSHQHFLGFGILRIYTIYLANRLFFAQWLPLPWEYENSSFRWKIVIQNKNKRYIETLKAKMAHKARYFANKLFFYFTKWSVTIWLKNDPQHPKNIFLTIFFGPESRKNLL